MTKDEALKLVQEALVALENISTALREDDVLGSDIELMLNTITSIHKALAQPVPESSACCHACFKASGAILMTRMILCPTCGNKRCPRASDHRLECTDINEPGQTGSVYTAFPSVQEPVAMISAWSLREVYFDEDGEPSMHRSPPQPPLPAQEPYCYVDPVHLAALNTDQSAEVVLNKNPSGYAARGLYTAPQQRPWVGLTDDDLLQIREIVQAVEGQSLLQSLTKAIETKLKEKNT